MTKTIANLTLALRLIGILLVVVPGFGVARGQSAQTQASAPSPRADAPVSSSRDPESSTDPASAGEYVISPEDILSVSWSRKCDHVAKL